MSQKKRKPDSDDDCFWSVTQCPCGRIVGYCFRHGGMSHATPECKEFRTMERGAYLDYVTRAMALSLFDQADDLESWPRA